MLHNKNKQFKRFDYNKKRLENPFFKKKRRSKLTDNLKIKAILIFIFFFVIICLWFFHFSSFARITKINIDGLNRISSDELYSLTEKQLRSRRFLILPQNNLLLFDYKKLLKILDNKYRFEGVKITKNWPHELNIKVIEKEFVCIWSELDSFYYADDEGFVLEEINLLDIKNKKYPLIHNKSKQKILNHKIQISTDYLKHVKEISEKLSKNSFDIDITKFIIDDDIDTIKIELKEGVKIGFSTKNDIEEQVKKLILIKNEKLKDSFLTKEYIDLRFGDKVYYQ